jgi:hypothetical protein
MLVSTGQVNTTGANSFSGLLALTARHAERGRHPGARHL